MSALPEWVTSQLRARGWQWQDARELDYREFLSWGWDPVDAAFAAYYGQPLRAVLVRAR